MNEKLDLIISKLEKLDTIESEQRRHGDLLHQLIQIVGSLSNEVKSNHEQTTAQFTALRNDIEITFDKTSRNELELMRLKRNIL